MPNMEKFHRKASRVCVNCKKSKNGFLLRDGTYKSDSEHDLCQRCWRGLHASSINEERQKNA